MKGKSGRRPPTRPLLALLLILGLALAACGPAAAPGAGDGKLKVVATYSVLGDLVKNVGGDLIDLTVLVQPDQDTHTYVPIPKDAAALADASLLFENGLGFETWLDDLYTASHSQAQRMVVTSTIEPIPFAEEHQTAGAADQAHGQYDPHVWHSVPNAIQMVQQIAGGLAQADPANAAAYHANAASYTGQLQDLDQWIVAQVSTIPENRRKLVTNHDSLGYFAKQYGFEMVGTLLPSTTEGASPSAQQLAALVEAVKQQGVPAVFAENIESNALINQLATEAGVKVVSTLYTDALGPPGSDGDTYLKMMRYNVSAITAALAS
jgi:zinc/manganese transport system substrate-binding protein